MAVFKNRTRTANWLYTLVLIALAGFVSAAIWMGTRGRAEDVMALPMALAAFFLIGSYALYTAFLSNRNN